MQKRLIEVIEAQLLPNLQLASERPFDPIVVYSVPVPWQLAGAGNYAAVLMHPSYPDMVVKVYAAGRSRLGRRRVGFFERRRVLDVVRFEARLRSLLFPMAA